MSLQGKGLTLGIWQVVGVKVQTCVATHLANLHGLLKVLKQLRVWCSLKACPPSFVPLSKPMEVARYACITVQLQLEHCSPQGCKILAAAQEKRSVNLDPRNLGLKSRPFTSQ